MRTLRYPGYGYTAIRGALLAGGYNPQHSKIRKSRSQFCLRLYQKSVPNFFNPHATNVWCRQEHFLIQILQLCAGKCMKWHFRASIFHIFPRGSMPLDPLVFTALIMLLCYSSMFCVSCLHLAENLNYGSQLSWN